jgi:4-hydroxybenzoate polyprenyltransferase
MTSVADRVLTQLKREMVYGGHITALIGPSLVMISVIFLDLPVNIISLLIAYLIPLLVYSYNYQKELDVDAVTNSEKVRYLTERNRIFPYLFYAYLLLTVILSFILNSIQFLTFLLIIFSGGILYTVIFKRLASIIPAFKNVFSTMVWAYSGTFFTIFLYSLNFDSMFLFIFVFIFLKIFINNIFFDIKDIASDSKEGLKTIPILLGKTNTALALTGLNVVALLLLVYSVYIKIIPGYALSLSIFFLYTQYYLIRGITANNSELLRYTYIVSDIEFIFWPIVLIAGKMLANGWLY